MCKSIGLWVCTSERGWWLCSNKAVYNKAEIRCHFLYYWLCVLQISQTSNIGGWIVMKDVADGAAGQNEEEKDHRSSCCWIEHVQAEADRMRRMSKRSTERGWFTCLQTCGVTSRTQTKHPIKVRRNSQSFLIFLSIPIITTNGQWFKMGQHQVPWTLSNILTILVPKKLKLCYIW